MSGYYYGGGLSKPPVMLPDRKEDFVCEVCHKPGYGAPGSKAHDGKCRQERNRQNAARIAARNRQRRRLALGTVAC